jgi:hypothetical protein
MVEKKNILSQNSLFFEKKIAKKRLKKNFGQKSPQLPTI